MTSHKSRQTRKAWLKSQKKTTHPLWEMRWMVICHHNQLNISDMILHITWPVCGYITFSTSSELAAAPGPVMGKTIASPKALVIGIPLQGTSLISISPTVYKSAPFESMIFRTSISVGCCWWRKSGEPVEVDSLAHYLQGFIHPRWFAGFLPSTKWQECHTSPVFLC